MRTALSRLAAVAVCLAALATTVHAAPGDSAVSAAYAAYQAGRSAALDEAAREVSATHPLAPYVEFWQLKLALPRADEASLRRFLQTQEGSRAAELLRAEWLKSLGAREEWLRFSQEFPRLTKPDTALTCYARRAEFARTEFARADRQQMKSAVALWFSGRDLPNACTPLFDTLFQQGALNPEDVWRRIRLALDAGNPRVARAAATRLPAGEFDSALLDRAARSAQAMLDTSPQNASRSAREIAIYAIGELARQDSARAEAALQRWSASFTEPERRAAWASVGEWAARRHEPDALAFFNKAGAVIPNDLQREWWGRAALRAGDWASVAAAIDAMGDSTRQLPEWRYWRARAHKAGGQTLAARQMLLPLAREHHYYGQLAQEELGPVVNQPRANFKVSNDEISAAAALPGVRRAFALMAQGWRSEAIAEWNFSVQQLPDDRQKLAAAEVALRAEWYDRAIYAAEQTRDNHDFELRFLAPYRELARAAAREHGLDEAWVYGLMRQESRFINVARSGVGAAGLMQIMPATARWIANKLGVGRAQADNMNDPSTNIRFGAFYLAHIQRQLDGSAVLATAAYNAGPGRAQRWRGARPMEGAVYVESIPFAETRDYVKKVLSNAMYYAGRFGQPSVLLRDRLGTIPPR